MLARPRKKGLEGVFAGKFLSTLEPHSLAIALQPEASQCELQLRDKDLWLPPCGVFYLHALPGFSQISAHSLRLDPEVQQGQASAS